MNDVVTKLRELLGSDCITDPALADGYLSDWRGLLRGNAACVLRPRTASSLSQCVWICCDAGVGVVPQGGNTGLVGGSTPDDTGLQVVVSTGAMKKIRAVDPIDMSISRKRARQSPNFRAPPQRRTRIFHCPSPQKAPPRWAVRWRRTQAAISAVRYGSARDLLLGMEVVLPDGRIWSGLRTVRKDNTGYALKHLFAGSEGTLGIITAAAMKLVPLPVTREVAFCAVETEDQVLDFWMKLRAAAEGNVRAIEYLSDSCVELAKGFARRSRRRTTTSLSN